MVTVYRRLSLLLLSMAPARTRTGYSRKLEGAPTIHRPAGAFNRLLAGALTASASLAFMASSWASDLSLSGDDIVRRAQQAAGGDAWVNARSLKLQGHATFYRDGQQGQSSVASSYTMWRVFPAESADAHAANGRVRFDARAGDSVLFQISFDGESSYDHNGRIDDAAATARWKSNFGFGIFRFALRDGFRVTRMADDSIDGHPCYFVKVTDPSERDTVFAVDQTSNAIRMVGFDTPQGFHHRIYDSFSRHAENGFVQPGHVKLFYDGVKTADIRWTDFELNPPIAPDTFVLTSTSEGAGS